MRGVYSLAQASPWGWVVMQASEAGLTRLYFATGDATQDAPAWPHTTTHPLLQRAASWLQSYIQNPRSAGAVDLPLDVTQASDFQQQVWQALMNVPCGQTRTYQDLSSQLSSSPRAVGRTLGSNPCLLIRPCHRIVATSGALTGYAAGLDTKRQLLIHEGLQL